MLHVFKRSIGTERRGKRTVRKGCFAILVVVSDDICDTADGTVVKRVDESGYADVFEVPIFGTSG